MLIANFDGVHEPRIGVGASAGESNHLRRTSLGPMAQHLPWAVKSALGVPSSMAKVEIELPDSLWKFYMDYSEWVGQSLNESMRQVLSDFAFGAIELGFDASQDGSGESSQSNH